MSDFGTLILSCTATVTPVMTLTGTIPAGTVGGAVDCHLTLGGTFVAPVTISGLPAWLSATVSGTDVHVTGTYPATAQTATFTVTATDSTTPTAQTATDPQSVVVSAASAGASIVQQAVNQWSSGVPSATLGAAPAVGNVLVALVVSGSYSSQAVASGWTLVASGGGTSAAGYWCGLLTHTVASGDGTTVSPTTAAISSGLAVWEVSGESAVALGNSGKFTSGTNSLSAIGASAPTAASIPLSLTNFNGASPNSVLGWPAGWTGIGPLQISGYPYYGAGAGYAAATSAAVTGPTLTWTGTRGNSVACIGALAYVR